MMGAFGADNENEPFPQHFIFLILFAAYKRILEQTNMANPIL